MPRENSRRLRVAAEMERLLNELLLSDVKDPRLAGVRVTAVEVSGDLGVATVFFNLLGLDDGPDEARTGFEQARGFFRSRIAQSLQMRRMPELRFRYDSSARRAAEIGRLIDDANAPGRSSD